MTTSDIHTLAGAYALHAVDDIERAQFDRHVSTCEACAQEVAELRAAAGRLADLTAVDPPVRLKASVMAEVARTRQVGPGRPAAESGAPAATARWRRWTAAAVAAGIIAVGAAAATFVIQDQRVRDAQHQAADAQEVAAILAAPDALVRVQPVAGGRVTVVVSESLNKGAALLNGLSNPGSSNAYQLWLIKGDQPDSLGTLAAGTGSGTKVFGDVHGAGAFGVSREPAAGSVTPTKPLVTTVGLS
jgi:anti-sigma-K factor RskA